MQTRALRISLVLVCLGLPSSVAAATCESLATLVLANGTVTFAGEMEAFTPPGTTNELRPTRPFCRVTATLKPSSRSDIRMEVWLPLNSWNGKLLLIGNGGFGGTIAYPNLAGWVGDGYVVASTDSGHTGPESNTFVNDDVLA